MLCPPTPSPLPLLTTPHILTCDPSSLAQLTGSRQRETVAWPLPPPPSPTFFQPPPPWGVGGSWRGRIQRPDLSISPILLPLAPLPLPPWAGRGQRKQSASPAHSHSLPHFLLREDGVLPPLHWLRTWPWCQVSSELPELEALPELNLDPSPLSISLSCIFYTLTQAL